MGDLKNKKLIVLKGVLFLLVLCAAFATIVVLTRDWLIFALLIMVVWSSMRFYYFLFYVLERYVNPKLKYAGICALLMAMAMAMARRPESGDREIES